jgi:hypothetical protein
MPTTVAKRIRSWRWRFVGGVGWIILLLGLVPFGHFVYTSLRNQDYRMESLPMVFAGCLMMFVGSVFVVVARKSQVRWFCSSCNQEIRNQQERFCPNCMTLFDGATEVSPTQDV